MAEDRQNFLNLLMANQKRIYNFILMLVPNYSDADDLMQETASEMWNKYDTFVGGTNFVAWGCAIARNKILNYRKKAGHSELLFSKEAIENILDESNKISSYRKKREQALQLCLAKLKENDRRLIALRYEQDCRLKTISEKTGRSVNGLSQTIARIHALLMECIVRTISSWEKC